MEFRRNLISLALSALMVARCSLAQTAQPASSTNSKQDASSAPKRVPTAQERYLVVPMRGEIGSTVTAIGLERALEDARKQKIAHIVFALDSPGGKVEEAEAIEDDFHRRERPLRG